MKSLGFAVVDWIETFLVHGPGDIEGEAIRLDDEFAKFVVKSYEVDAAGKKKIRRSVISRPKGRAKSNSLPSLQWLKPWPLFALITGQQRVKSARGVTHMRLESPSEHQ